MTRDQLKQLENDLWSAADKLREEFKQAAHKNIEIADLRAFLQYKLEQMLQQNATRTNFAQRLQEIIGAVGVGFELKV